MNPKIIKTLIIIFAATVVAYPLYLSAADLKWAFDSTLLSNLFPLFGLFAYTLLWLHIVGPSFEPWLSRYVNFQNFLNTTSPIILISMLLHPILLFITLNFNLNNIFEAYGTPYIMLGIIGLILLLTFDIGKALRKYDLIKKNREKILLTSTIGFLIIFFHSFQIGGNLQGDPLRSIWLFYGVTSIISATYLYGYKRFFR